MIRKSRINYANVFTIKNDGKNAQSILYYDSMGRRAAGGRHRSRRVRVQQRAAPAELKLGASQPRDPPASSGATTRTRPAVAGDGWFERGVQALHGAGALSAAIDDFNADNLDYRPVPRRRFDHRRPGGARPIHSSVPPGLPRSAANGRRSRSTTAASSASGSGRVAGVPAALSDLDPSYRDKYGNPLLRITFDWQLNGAMIAYAGTRCSNHAGMIPNGRCKGGPLSPTAPGSSGRPRLAAAHFDTTRTSDPQHRRRDHGRRSGASVVNNYLQMWDA
jgi:gluconate 2-dehydrogenase alpha chain